MIWPLIGPAMQFSFRSCDVLGAESDKRALLPDRSAFARWPHRPIRDSLPFVPFAFAMRTHAAESSNHNSELNKIILYYFARRPSPRSTSGRFQCRPRRARRVHGASSSQLARLFLCSCLSSRFITRTIIADSHLYLLLSSLAMESSARRCAGARVGRALRR